LGEDSKDDDLISNSTIHDSTNMIFITKIQIFSKWM